MKARKISYEYGFLPITLGIYETKGWNESESISLTSV